MTLPTFNNRDRRTDLDAVESPPHASDPLIGRADSETCREPRNDFDYSRTMKRRTVSLSDEAAGVLDRIAKAHSTTVSGVVDAAGMALAEGGRDARPILRQIVPDRRGGRREGSGRPKGTKQTS